MQLWEDGLSLRHPSEVPLKAGGVALGAAGRQFACAMDI